MPFDSYDELITTVERYLARSDFREEVVDFIYLAEKEMQVSAELRINDAVFEGTFIIDQDWIPAPKDMIEPRYLRSNSPQVSSSNVVSIYKWTDVAAVNKNVNPSAIMHHGFRIYLAGTPGDAETYTLFYKGGFPRLSADKPSNFILEQFPMCYLYGALANAAPYIGSDERVPQWIEQAQHWIAKLRTSEANARLGGGKLRMRPDNADGWVPSGVRRGPW